MARSSGTRRPCDALLQQPEGQQVVGAEGGRRSRRGRHPGQPCACLASLGDGRAPRCRPPAGRPRARPAAAQAARAPSARSRTWPSAGPPTKAIPSWPRSSRCSTASWPPRTSSTATEQTARRRGGRPSRPGCRARRSWSRRRGSGSTGVIRIPWTRCCSSRSRCCCLARSRRRAVAEEQRAARRLGRLLDAAGDVGEERVAGVEHHVGEGAAAARPQLAGRLVADEPELASPARPGPGSRADQVGAVEHVGDRAE